MLCVNNEREFNEALENISNRRHYLMIDDGFYYNGKEVLKPTCFAVITENENILAHLKLL